MTVRTVSYNEFNGWQYPDANRKLNQLDWTKRVSPNKHADIRF